MWGGWFKENWQREKMVAAGLTDFGPVQQNISFSDAAGVARSIHAEPWDKRAFGAWVDLPRGLWRCSTIWLHHFSNSGPVVSGVELAREVFRLVGADPDAIRPVKYCVIHGFSGRR